MATKKKVTHEDNRKSYVGPYFNEDDLEPMGNPSAADLAQGQPVRVYDPEKGRYVVSDVQPEGDDDEKSDEKSDDAKTGDETK